MTPTLDEQLSGLSRSAIPVWVIDMVRMRIVWANPSAIELWRAHDLADLGERDLSAAPLSVRVRTAAIHARVVKGETVIEEWTLYPQGVPTSVRLHLTGMTLADGSIGLLNQATPSGAAPEPEVLRGIEALRHTPVIVALVSESGSILMQNPAAITAFGDRATWPDWFVDAEGARKLVASVLASGERREECRVLTQEGERTHLVGARVTRDPVSGEAVVLVDQVDETQRRSALEKAAEQTRIAAELNSMLAVVERQRAEILALSAPILDVGPHTIATPIIGALDATRSTELAERLLPLIAERKASRVIIDLTGAGAVETDGAAKLLDVVRAIRLLGARAVLAGVQPPLARQLAELGFADQEVTIARTLAQALT